MATSEAEGATVAVGPGVRGGRRGSGGRGGGVQAQPPQRDGRSGSDVNQVWHAMMQMMTTQISQMLRDIIVNFSTQMSDIWGAIMAMGEQHARHLTQSFEQQHQSFEQQHQHLMAFQARTEERFIQLEERIDNLEKQAKLDKK